MIFWYILVVTYFCAGSVLLLQAGMQGVFMWAVNRKKSIIKESSSPIGTVLVQLPVYNEPEVVEQLLQAVAGIELACERLEIQILDDSTDATTQRIDSWLAAHPTEAAEWKHIRRPHRRDFKAGALADGMKRVPDAQFVAIFDADFRPSSDFVRRAISKLQGNEGVGAIQARWSHANAQETFLTAIQALNLDAHFTVEQGGRSVLAGRAAFNGTAGVWRKQAIADSGGWSGDTLAEDLDLSVRAHLNGWEIWYADELEAPALLPRTFAAYATQQHRWTSGGAACARKHFKAVWSTNRGRNRRLALGQLFASSIHVPVALMTVSSVPLLALEAMTGRFSWVLPAGAIFSLALLLLIGMYAYSYRLRGGRGGFGLRMLGMLLLGTGMTWRNVRSVLAGWMGRSGEFVRTPKGNGRQESTENGVPWEVGWAAYFALAMGLGCYLGEWGLVPFHALLAAGYAWVAQMAWNS